MEEDSDTLLELIESIQEDDCTLFLDSGLSRLPGSDPLAEALLDCLASDVRESKPTLARIAQYYEVTHGRHALVQMVRDTAGIVTEPSPIHRLAAQLPISAYFSTSYDDLLAKALREAGRQVMVAQSSTELPYIGRGSTLLVNLFGSVSDPLSLVVTEKDLLELYMDRATWASPFQYLFATKTLLFIGYDLSDDQFVQLFHAITKSVDRHWRKAYAVSAVVSSHAANYWARMGVEIVEAKPDHFLSRLVEAVTEVSPATAPPPPLPSTPYKFLDYFTSTDVRIFFGRDSESTQLARLILSHSLTVLFGRAGVGKTSLIMAGVMPKMQEEDYITAYSRLLDDPVQAIMVAVAQAAGHDIEPVSDSADISLRLFLERLLPAGTRLVVFVDQFEELFVRLGQEYRDRFAQALSRCLESELLDIRFLLIMREDFLGDLAELKEHLPDIFYNSFRLRNMTEDQAEAAIVEPAKAFGLAFKRDLVDALLTDLYFDGIEPSQLQIICSQLYEDLSPDRRTFTLSSYQSLGGARAILANYLDAVLKRFNPAQRSIAQALMKALVSSSGTGTALTLAELLKDDLLAREMATRSAIEAVLGDLVAQRVLRRVPPSGYYELSHDLIARKVQEWLSTEEAELKSVRDFVTRRLSDYERFGFLLREEELELIGQYSDRLLFDDVELELLVRSAMALRSHDEYWLTIADKAAPGAEWLDEVRAERSTRHGFNPYIVGQPVLNRRMFFGREKEMRAVLRIIHNNSIMVHGERRIGKTSFLHQLKLRLEAEPDPDYQFTPVFLDLQGVTEGQFFYCVMQEIEHTCRAASEGAWPELRFHEVSSRYGFNDFQRDLGTVLRHMQKHSNKEIKLLLLMDEIDVMNSYDQIVQQRLRRIFMEEYAESLGAIVAGVDIRREWTRLESPFYNLFTELELLPMDREAARQLIQEPVRGIYRYDPDAVERIIQYSQGRPQLVQQHCLLLVNRILDEDRRRIAVEDVDDVHGYLTRECEDYAGDRLAAKTYIQELATIEVGLEDSGLYDEFVTKVLGLLFSSHLTHPREQARTVEGRSVRDLILFNGSTHPFWASIRQEYGASHIVFEFKNTNNLSVAQVDQLASYLGKPLGDFGIFVTRTFPPSRSVIRKIVSIYHRSRKLILVLGDSDVEAMLETWAGGGEATDIIRRKYTDLVSLI